MNKELGVWTYKDCALVLIDYQKEMFQTIRSETSAALAEINVRLLARTAKALDMPIVLSTIGVAYKINSPTVPGIVGELPDLEPIDRTSMNAFEDRLFLTFAVVQALKDGYDAMFVTDAVGGRSQVAHRTAIERLSHAGAVPNTALAVLTELFRDWTSPMADKARQVINWYFAEVPKVTSDVGV